MNDTDTISHVTMEDDASTTTKVALGCAVVMLASALIPWPWYLGAQPVVRGDLYWLMSWRTMFMGAAGFEVFGGLWASAALIPIGGLWAIKRLLRGPGVGRLLGFVIGMLPIAFMTALFLQQLYSTPEPPVRLLGDFLIKNTGAGGHLAMLSGLGLAFCSVYRRRFHIVFSVDLRSMALLRVCLGSMLLSDLLHRLPDVLAHYTDFGVLPRSELLSQFLGIYVHSIHTMNGQGFTIYLLFALAMVFSLLFMLGYRTRLFHVLSWVMLISLQARNPIVLQGGDVLFRLLMFWTMFLPLGAYWSIDSALNSSDERPPRSVVSVGGVALMLQTVLVYLVAAALKTHKDWFPDGNAVMLALSLDHFSTPVAHALLEHYHSGNEWLLRSLTLGTWWLEKIGPLLFFLPFKNGPVRTVMVALFCCLHLGFILTLKIGMFVFVSCSSLMVFLPTWFWDKVETFVARRKPGELTVWYDAGCGICHKGVHLLRTFLILRKTQLKPAQDTPEMESMITPGNAWVVVTPDGAQHIRSAGMRAVLEASPLFWPFSSRRFWLPFTLALWGGVALVYAALGVDIAVWRNARVWVVAPLLLWLLALLLTSDMWLNRVYGVLSSSRRLVSWVPMELQFRPYKWRSSWLGSVTCAILIGYVVLWNIGTLPGTPYKIQAKHGRLAYTLRLDQKWNMFAPYPLKDDGWFIIEGRLKNGQVVNLWSRLFDYEADYYQHRETIENRDIDMLVKHPHVVETVRQVLDAHLGDSLVSVEPTEGLAKKVHIAKGFFYYTITVKDVPRRVLEHALLEARSTPDLTYIRIKNWDDVIEGVNDKPALVSNMYPNQRWRKYMMNLWMRNFKKHRLHFSRYVCRWWNNAATGQYLSHPNYQMLQTFNLYYVKERTTYKGHAPRERIRIWKHWCFKRKGTFDRGKNAKPNYPPDVKKASDKPKKPPARPAS